MRVVGASANVPSTGCVTLGRSRASRSALASSVADAKRSRGSLRSSRATIDATAGLTPAAFGSIAGASAETCLSATATALSPVNGSAPVSI